MAARPRLFALNAGLGGSDGNSSVLVARAAMHLAPHAEVEIAVLASEPGFAAHRERLLRADGILIASGTYWDGFSSLLQQFFEEATETEGTSLWLGKPAACLISAHAVGGKAVLSRLQGVLVTLGVAIPPMSGLVITEAAQLAIERAHDSDDTSDFWSPSDLEVVCHNLLAAAQGNDRDRYRAWDVDRRDPKRRWMRSANS